jgi:flagellar capping protein FliD
LEDKVTAVATTVNTLKDALGGTLLKATVSNTAAAKATISAGAVEGTYTLGIKSLGAYAAAMSNGAGLPKVSNPATDNLTTQTSFTLTLTGIDDPDASKTFAVNTAAGASLNALAEAINTKTEGKVTATVVNVGTAPDKPDYRLSLQCGSLGKTTITLNDGAQELMATTAAGELAKYTLAGGTNEFTSTSRSLNIAPGITLDLTGKNADGDFTTISVKRDAGGIGNALTSLTSAYNALIDELDKYRGGTGGALAGDAILNTVANAMHSLIAYSEGGRAASSLIHLGLEFDSKGRLSLNAAAFNKATESAAKMDDATKLLGSASGGFVKYALRFLDGLTHEDTGILAAHVTSLDDESKRAEEQIAANQDRVDAMERDLRQRLSAADAAIAALEQQANYMINMFAQMRANAAGQ